MEKYIKQAYMELVSQYLEANAKISAELASLRKENILLRQKISEIEQNYLPLSDFLDYAEDIPAEQNGRTRVIKEMLNDLFTNISPDDKIRLKKLGTKNTTRLMEVHTSGGTAILGGEFYNGIEFNTSKYEYERKKD